MNSLLNIGELVFDKLKKNMLNPKCFKVDSYVGLAITNRGHLIPCCRCDEPETMNDSHFKKLLAVSKISENEKIEDIIKQKEWVQFFQNLKKGIGPHCCYDFCAKDKAQENIQSAKYIDASTNNVLHEEEW